MVTRKVICRRLKLIKRGRRELRHILTQNRHILTQNRCIPLASIIEKMNEKVCVRTLKEIKRIGFDNCVAAKKPFLTNKQKADRLAFAKKYQAWSSSD